MSNYYDSTSDLTAALISKKIDGFLEDEPVARMLNVENNSISCLNKPLIKDDYSFVFTKADPSSEKYVSEFNKMLAEMKENGELEQLKLKWTESSNSEITSEKYDLTGGNGTIKVAMLPDIPPFSFLNDEGPVGYSVDLINAFAYKYGYSLEYEYGNAVACLAGIGTGKYDVMIGSISVTEERKETMYFTDTIYNGGLMLVLRADDISSGTYTDPMQMNDPSYTLGAATGSSGMLAAEKYLPNAELLMFDDNVTPLKDVCAEINKGDVISIIGPYGTGKSTLLRCLNQLESPTSGKVIFNGENITSSKCKMWKIRQKMGMVFQSFNLFNNLNVIGNIMAGPVDLLKMKKEDAFREDMKLLKKVGLSEKAYIFPDELSGGQKQRVAIARAIAMNDKESCTCV
ncbi:MAG: transporter substrate-binding domain-containing protein [Ruminococcus sp.]|nr:transporter substrate-binding domain-containing protein [Ruminococcus sp.]